MALATTLLLAVLLQSPPSPQSALLREVGFDQHPGAAVPRAVELVDESGARVPFDSVLRGRPVVLALVYYRCPMLCTLVLNGLLRAARATSFDAGRDYDIVAISIDPAEGPELAASKRGEHVAAYGRASGADGWRFLTGPEASVRAIASAVGFRYAKDPRSGEYAHASGLVLLTPDGRVSRYLFGVEYAPRDLQLGLVEASAGTIGGLVEQLLLLCFHYDPASGRYGFAIVTALRALGAATVAAIAGFILWHLRRERRRRAAHPAAAEGA
jgi:protein SCO1/2